MRKVFLERRGKKDYPEDYEIKFEDIKEGDLFRLQDVSDVPDEDYKPNQTGFEIYEAKGDAHCGSDKVFGISAETVSDVEFKKYYQQTDL